MQSSEGRKLSNDEYFKFHDVTMTASSIIEKIQKKYDDDILYMAFMLEAADILKSREFLQDHSKRYSRKCAPQMLTDVQTSIKNVESTVNSLLRKK